MQCIRQRPVVAIFGGGETENNSEIKAGFHSTRVRLASVEGLCTSDHL